MNSSIDSVINANIGKVLYTAGNDFKLFREKLGSRMSSKLQSEIISATVENAFASVVEGARVGNGDHEADVYINEIPLELKTSRDSREWRGGEFSKRSGDFLLISWSLTKDTNEINWFVIHTLLTESDWKSSGSASYYATSISLDDALNKNGRVIVGDVRQAIKLRHPIYESLTS